MSTRNWYNMVGVALVFGLVTIMNPFSASDADAGWYKKKPERVKVINGMNMPVPVIIKGGSSSNAPLIEPVNACLDPFLPGGGFQSPYTVPSDRLLVIEDASIEATMDDGEVVRGQIKTTVGGVEARHHFGQLNFVGFSFESAGRKMRLYADPGTMVFTGAATSGDPEDIVICFSGQLLPIPAP